MGSWETGKKGKESCSACGLFMELVANLVSMGIFMDIWYWSKAEVGDTSLFLCLWLKRTKERRIDSLPFLAKGEKMRFFWRPGSSHSVE